MCIRDRPKKVYQDAIMRGGRGVKPAKVGGFPRLKVTDRGNVIRNGKDTGVGNEFTKFVGGDGKIFQGGKEVGEVGKTTPGISVRDDGSIMAGGVLYKDKEEFEDLAYLTIYPEDSVKMMIEGEARLYKDLRDKLLVQCAFVALDPNTGGILAMIGGRPDYHDQYNRAVQAKRQPGSVFKPFVYTVSYTHLTLPTIYSV